ncbi:Satratoxin biosynthesis SC1 cluster protein 4 [Colletotrichum siamense]|uniref:Rhodopsin domain-containing protein n=1 Tax=Colletotrichum noveboracense TaxID=2664923 RepID=A0A9W4RX42_9PEZI|nr:Satratoxin biosynthesis SC1 cluster protein 4 [Colletotrichum siamense]KAH9230109.1 hypothetical protein K456DRAFT_1898516 [Colletotrichum gloeosporioides 23]KAI8152822.1 hypothetical protein K4K50_009093 [Colletotrichum sp. SAR 10_71]KAI8181432.1 hypothetical protein K4K49_001193 [Colletotrichum sp. SAR 10_70]KAI8184446.1 hypothetical protein K4K51_012541 [Colletotrichum sp. SAR 10_75]KAI8207678.1 hypothetical protein KHU50_009544 [Colletotrichum sp. SAR 10_65]KAI8228816.1 hypothetical pr
MDLPKLTPEEMAEDRSATVIGVVTMCFVLSTFFLVLRLWTRIHVVKSTGPDDWAAAFSLIPVLGCGIAIATMTRYGLGKHIQTVSVPEYVEFTKCFWVSVVFYGLGHLSFKMAFLLQYYRVLASGHMRKFYIAAMVLVTAWGVSVVIMSLAFCTPIAGFWDHSIPAKCLSQQVLYYVFGACSIITDVIIFLLPLPALMKLQLPRSQKWYLLGIFSLGFFIVAISVFRLQFLNIQADFTYWNVKPALWSMGELSAAMVCLCLPPLKALLARMGLVVATRQAVSSNNRNSRNFGPAPASVAQSATGKTLETSQTNSPGEKPSAFGNFVVETERDRSEQSTSSSLPPV